MQNQSHLLVCIPLDPEIAEFLSQHVTLTQLQRWDVAAVAPHLASIHGLIVGEDADVTYDIIDHALNLRVIGCTSDHLDRIDVTAARDYGIEVRSSPTGDTVAISEQTLMWLLQLAHGTLAGKTLGMIGFGRTSRQIAKRAQAFQMRVLVNQPRLTPELALSQNVEKVDLHDLLKQSDFVSLHVANKPETTALLGSTEFAMMKKGASVINFGARELIDEVALQQTLIDNHLAAAIIAKDSADFEHANLTKVKRPSRATNNKHDSMQLARQIIDILRIKRPSETLSLDIVPTDQVMPHEHFDQKRVDRLKASLSGDGLLVNPPLVTHWAGKYVILDGATRFNSLKQLGYPHIAVQLVDPKGDFTLHTWYHAISNDQPFDDLLDQIKMIDGVELTKLDVESWHSVFDNEQALCYFLDRQGAATLLSVSGDKPKLEIMNEVVACYTRWGSVERTLLTDVNRLLGQFEKMAAVAIFPQFEPTDVFDVARHGQLLPAGLTRFVIPNRVLHLNVELGRLKSAEPIATKRAWLNQFLANKLARSNIRYYQEPVILID